MALNSRPKLARSDLRRLSRCIGRPSCRTFAASAVRSHNAWEIRADSPKHTITGSDLPLRKDKHDPPDRTIQAEDRPPPGRLRNANSYWHSTGTKKDSPVRFYAINRQDDPPGFQGRNPWDKDRDTSNTTQTKQRAKYPKTGSGGRETRQRITSTRAEETEAANTVGIFVDGHPVLVSPILLRDLCGCASCLDPSTKQKLFSTADIPSNIKARATAQDTSGVTVHWENDVSGYGEDHATILDMNTVRSLRDLGAASSADTPGYQPGKQLSWDAQQYRQLEDIDYEAYMQDDLTLFRALQQLHTHGLLFLQNVPEDEKSVSAVAERIGAVKNTFYGYTWDVRSVPEAKNVAYTSQDLGFHMDLMYMHQPPHLQFLHCIRSSAAGGASLFADSYKAAADLFKEDVESFLTLVTNTASFHYNHPSSHLYHQDWSVIQTTYFNKEFKSFLQLARAYKKDTDPRYLESRAGRARDVITSFQSGERDIVDYIENVAWSPPFQAPFRLAPKRARETDGPPSKALNSKMARWHSAAQKFSSLIHREAGIYERLMKPGECVIFDNRRVLHARRAFEAGDAGKERWLRGAYLDWDPYWSKMSVLGKKFGIVTES